MRRANRSSPRQIGTALDVLSRRVAPATELASIQALWPKVAERLPLAAEGEPIALHGQTLTVRCASSMIAQELEWCAAEIADYLNRALGRETVAQLRFRAL